MINILRVIVSILLIALFLYGALDLIVSTFAMGIVEGIISVIVCTAISSLLVFALALAYGGGRK